MGGRESCFTSRIHKVEEKNTISALNIIGIDVSKDKLDVCLLRPNGKQIDKIFDNTSAGHKKLLRWATHLTGEEARHFALEATGSYGTACATHLSEQSERVSVLNPARVKAYGIALGVLNKTDRADARLIARFCKAEPPELWRLATPEARLLTALVRRREQIVEQRTAERNRSKQPGLPKEVHRSHEQTIRFLEKQIGEIEKSISEHIDKHPTLQADHKLLVSIPGVADTLSSVLLAELPTLSECTNSAAIGSYAGLSPREHRSGSSVQQRTHISKSGNAALRRALYMPTLSAIRCNPLVKALYDRLVGRGMCPKAALCAAMRKLLMIAVGILKNRTKFDADFILKPA